MLSFFILAFTLYTLHFTPYTLHPTLYALRFTLYTFYSSLITHSLYLKLRFPSLVPCLSPSHKRPTMNQRRTKERPKNPKIQKVLFIKICRSFFLSYTSPYSTERRPREHRERSASTPCPQKVTFVMTKCIFLI